MSATETLQATEVEAAPKLEVPATQRVLLLHGVKQHYQVTDNYAIPDTKHDHELLVRSHTIGLNPIDWKSP